MKVPQILQISGIYPIPYVHLWILYLAVEKRDFQNESVAREVWKSFFLFDILALLLDRLLASYSASRIQTRSSQQSNLVIYTSGPAPMCELRSSHNEPASCPVHCGGLLVWSASTIEPRTLHLLLPRSEPL
jgi:hypothetical protein